MQNIQHHLICSSSLPLVEGIIVLMLTAVNLALCVREERLRKTEMVRSVQNQLNNYDGKQLYCWNFKSRVSAVLKKQNVGCIGAPVWLVLVIFPPIVLKHKHLNKIL